MTTLVDELRNGVIEHKKRWSGDTHSDLGGSVDCASTDALMDSAADEIERLQGYIDDAIDALEYAIFWVEEYELTLSRHNNNAAFIRDAVKSLKQKPEDQQ